VNVNGHIESRVDVGRGVEVATPGLRQAATVRPVDLSGDGKLLLCNEGAPGSEAAVLYDLEASRRVPLPVGTPCAYTSAGTGSSLSILMRTSASTSRTTSSARVGS
jgi:hypothetical protein